MSSSSSGFDIISARLCACRSVASSIYLPGRTPIAQRAPLALPEHLPQAAPAGVHYRCCLAEAASAQHTQTGSCLLEPPAATCPLLAQRCQSSGSKTLTVEKVDKPTAARIVSAYPVRSPCRFARQFSGQSHYCRLSGVKFNSIVAVFKLSTSSRTICSDDPPSHTDHVCLPASTPECETCR